MKTSDRTRILYEQPDLPIFQNVTYESAAAAIGSPRGDMRLVEDLTTGLVRNDAFDPSLMVYDTTYHNEQVHSPTFLRYLEAMAGFVVENLGTTGLVDVGCGKGEFLELLVSKGCDVIGFDPSYAGTNPRIHRAYFDPGVGLAARVVMLRHVLEHIPDPYGFLCQIRDANGGSGEIFIEVANLDWKCRHRAWFDVSYEQVNFLRLADFRRMFGSIRVQGESFGGQYIHVVADLASLRPPIYRESDRIDFPRDFAMRLHDVIRLESEPTAVWGGASKGVVFSLMRQRAGLPISAVIDINPVKQGRYMALSGLEIMSPTNALPGLKPGSAIYIMNRNYAEEIKSATDNRFKYIEVDYV